MGEQSISAIEQTKNKLSHVMFENLGVTQVSRFNPPFYDTREISAFSRISFALRGKGATVGCLRHPRWGASGAQLGSETKRRYKNIKNLGLHGRPIFGALGAPRMGRQLAPPLAAIKSIKFKIWGAFGAPNFGRLRHPKWLLFLHF